MLRFFSTDAPALAYLLRILPIGANPHLEVLQLTIPDFSLSFQKFWPLPQLVRDLKQIGLARRKIGHLHSLNARLTTLPMAWPFGPPNVDASSPAALTKPALTPADAPIAEPIS